MDIDYERMYIDAGTDYERGSARKEWGQQQRASSNPLRKLAGKIAVWSGEGMMSTAMVDDEVSDQHIGLVAQLKVMENEQGVTPQGEGA